MSTLTVLATDLAAETKGAIVRQYFAASRGDNKAAAMAACFAVDCVSQDPVDGPALRGRDEVYQFLQAIADLFVCVTLTEDFMVVNGDEVAVKWTGHGVGKNGDAVCFEGIDVFGVNANNEIQSLRGYWHPATVLAALQQA